MVQELIKQNSKFPGNGGGGGNKDKGNNLFSHVVKCGICGSSMQFVDKGIKYLICDSRRRKHKVSIEIKKEQKQIDAKIAAKLNRRKIPDSKVSRVEMVCTAKSIPYDEFEKVFFENFDELDINKLLPTEDETTQLKKDKENVLAINNLKLEELESQLDYLAELVLSNRDNETLERFDRKNEETKNVVAQLQEENEKLVQEIEELTKQRDTLKKQKDSIKEVYSFLGSANDEQELIDRRFQLRHEIQKMFEWIKIYPLQDKYVEYDEIQPEIIQLMKSKYINKLRYKFRNIDLHGHGGALYLKNYIDIFK